MKKLLGMLALLGVAVLLGCTQPQTPPASSAFDCGSNTTCFQNYSETCSPAKVSIHYADIPGYPANQPDMTFYMEVKSGTPQACQVYMRFDDYSIPATMELNDTARAQIELGMNMMKGKDMTCTMATASTSATAFSPDQCTGSLADIMKMSQGNSS